MSYSNSNPKKLKFYKRKTINGETVLIHRQVAERILRRKLLNSEVVHHIDEDKLNNDPSNLMVMRSQSDHAALHNGMKPFFCSDKKHYYCTNVGEKKKSICKCGNLMTLSKSVVQCLKCYKKEKSKNLPSKSELVNVLISKKGNFSATGSLYGVSCNAVRKWCKKYSIPHHSSHYKCTGARAV